MSILTKIHEMGLAANGLRTMHETGKYITSQIPNTSQEDIVNVEHSFSGPSTSIVGKSTLFQGTAPYGYVEIYSSGKAEKTAPVFNGHYYANLYFSKPGTYLLYSMWLERYKSNDVYVEVSPPTGCRGCSD
ncbi:MAG: hypothetical protein ACYDAO_04240 [Thermoplasmataceae archaeon]